MFNSYLYPAYRYPFFRSPYGYPVWQYGGVNSFNSINSIGSAIAVQNMNTIGVGAIGGTQIATPTVVW